jgi:hypothetical protein
MPPYGNLYGIPVYVDRLLAGEETIVLQARTHTDTISMKYADYARLVRPRVVRFARHFREIVATTAYTMQRLAGRGDIVESRS